MKIAQFIVDQRPLKIHYLELQGVQEIMDAVVVRDEYQLGQLKASGYQVQRVWDIGCHMGFFAAMVFHFWPDAEVIGVEPDKDLIPVEYQNCMGRRFQATSGAIRYDGKSDFYVSKYTGGSLIFDGTVTFDENIPKNYTKRKVGTLTLEELGNANQLIDLLKLDCEGSEFDILCGMTRELRQRIRRIVGELHHLAGFHYLEPIIRHRFPHLTPKLRSDNPEATIALFEAI